MGQIPDKKKTILDTGEAKAVVNDAARKDGGKLTDDKQVPPEQIEKIEHNAVDHTVDEPGS